ncbi:tetratricopeptide repeat protein [Xanthovirga aplysinae]|uniref:tetratricopeptide repeat protein n=1 Tax=Xanthovirga aplysinae TaxID=2529853 RepID=UPI0012BBBCF1|nr:tetratricopeptide repeat protein [Xanthovirga aplysinae]MTI29779.1 tetratricopeptide repeat protein [Xanthovirga aplysinae]
MVLQYCCTGLKKLGLYIFLFVFLVSIPYSLKAETKNEVEEKMSQTYALARKHISDNPALALNFSEKLNTLATKAGDSSYLAKAYLLTGFIFKDQLEFKAAINNLGKALELVPENSSLAVYICSNLGWTYNLMGDNENALKYSLKSIEINKYLGIESNDLENTLGLIYLDQGQFDKAFNIFQESIRKAKSNKDILEAEGNLGWYYLVLEELDSAQYYLDRSFELFKTSNNYNRTYVEANLLSNFGHLALKKGNLDEAQRYLEDCYNLSAKFNIGITLKESLEGLTKIFLAKNDAHKYHEYSQKYLTFRNNKKEQLEEYYLSELERKEGELADQKLVVANVEGQKTNLLWIGAIILTAFLLTVLYGFLLFRQRSRVITNPYTGEKIDLSPLLKYLNQNGYDLKKISNTLEKDAEFWLDYDPKKDLEGEVILKRLENFERLSKAFKGISQPAF